MTGTFRSRLGARLGSRLRSRLETRTVTSAPSEGTPGEFPLRRPQHRPIIRSGEGNACALPAQMPRTSFRGRDTAMTRLALVDRVRSWFGGKGRTAGISARPRPLASAARTELALAANAVGGASAAADMPQDVAAPQPVREPAAETASRIGTGARSAPPTTCLDPLDPEWLQAVPSLEEIGSELDGHRETNRTIMETVQRLPDLASNQADLTVETNKVLLGQTALLESILDSITSLRSAFQTINEGSRRQAVALAQLEAAHREVLLGYQTMLLKAHRRLGRLAALAILVAAAALGGTGYVAYLVLVAS